MPKGTPADDMAVRLSWPQPPSPFADTNHDQRERGSETAEGRSTELELVLKRLDVISHQLKALTDAVESLLAAGSVTRARGGGDATVTGRAPRRATARRQSAT